MKIKRFEHTSDEIKIKASKWSDYKHFHKIFIRIFENEIIIERTYNYLYGHGPEELDKIYIQSNDSAILKSYDINKIKSYNTEEQVIDAMINHIDDDIKIKNDLIFKLNKDIDILKNKKIKIANVFRKEKIKRLI